MTFPATIDAIANVSSGQPIASSYQNQVTNAVLAIEGAVGTNPARAVCEGRLTLTSGVPITTSDVLSATTVYFTPYNGNRISLFDGSTVWNIYELASDLTLALGTLTANTNYDVFCYDNAGTPTLELGPDWSTDSMRATDIVLQDGIWVQDGALTRRYLGTLRTDGTGLQTEDSGVKRLLWNMYNRVPRPLYVTDASASWTYSTASWRQANGSSANEVQVVVGLEGITLHLQAAATRSNTSAGVGSTGIGINSNTAVVGGTIMTAGTNVASAQTVSTSRYDGFVGLGWSYCTWLEYGSGTGTDTWYGTSGQLLSGLSGYVL